MTLLRIKERADGKMSNLSSHASTTRATAATQKQNRKSKVDVSSKDVRVTTEVIALDLQTKAQFEKDQP
ncbi:hypothetical protein SUGI_0749730 [Cryptomeria japonica]|nr:hypothetical protein SUGI_0749730 [Cryptomeria japonica]